jgi:hypothetical protein
MLRVGIRVNIIPRQSPDQMTDERSSLSQNDSWQVLKCVATVEMRPTGLWKYSGIVCISGINIWLSESLDRWIICQVSFIIECNTTPMDVFYL